MSLVDIRPFFESCAKAQGFKVLTEAFAKDSLKGGGEKRAYVELGVSDIRRQMGHAEHKVPVKVDLYIGSSRQTLDLEKTAYEAGQNFAGETIRKIVGSGVHRVICRNIKPEPINQNNDNAVIVHLEFEATVIQEF